MQAVAAAAATAACVSTASNGAPQFRTGRAAGRADETICCAAHLRRADGRWKRKEDEPAGAEERSERL
uniref:Putative secreted protein n=1 Tax=Anopheles marajoara TaxID=58244 RepID=A0A2M4CF35_9DIPT